MAAASCKEKKEKSLLEKTTFFGYFTKILIVRLSVYIKTNKNNQAEVTHL